MYKHILAVISVTVAWLMLGTGCGMVRPQVITEEEYSKILRENGVNLHHHTRMCPHRLDLKGVLQRALDYNIELYIRKLEAALNYDVAEIASLDALPKIVMSAGYRIKDPVQQSRTLKDGGVQSNVNDFSAYSTSEMRELRNLDVNFTWSFLDFVTGYLAAKRKSTEFLLTQIKVRKTKNELIKQGYTLYWKIVALMPLLDRADQLLAKVDRVLTKIDKIYQQKLQDPIGLLGRAQEIQEARKQVIDLRYRYNKLFFELRELLGLPPFFEIELIAPAGQEWQPPQVKAGVETLINQALADRYELVEESYNNRLDQIELRQRMLDVLPNLSLDFMQHYDSSPFIKFRLWRQGSVNLGLSLLRMLAFPSRYAQLQDANHLASVRRLGVHMAILVQTALAYENFKSLDQRYQGAVKSSEILSSLDKNIDALEQAGIKNEVETVTWELKSFVNEINRAETYAQLQEGYVALQISIGNDDIDTIAQPN